ncbi:MAG: hypothetical protein MK086_06215 [Flavobacteriales bacterium]|nr:hypothetical protein [Flavobacteriales bacterium]
MGTLSDNWLIEPVFDYEYKTYQILAFTSKAENRFGRSMLFPYLSDVEVHLRRLRFYKKNVLNLESEIKTNLVGVNLKRLLLTRERLEDDGVIGTLNDVVEFAIERLSSTYHIGLLEKEMVKQRINISPVGLLSPNSQGGLILLRNNRKTRIYKYRYRFVRRPYKGEAYKDVMTEFLDERITGTFPNFQDLKMEYRDGYQINTYLIEPETEIPVFETVLPVAKEFLLSNGS